MIRGANSSRADKGPPTRIGSLRLVSICSSFLGYYICASSEIEAPSVKETRACHVTDVTSCSGELLYPRDLLNDLEYSIAFRYKMLWWDTQRVSSEFPSTQVVLLDVSLACLFHCRYYSPVDKNLNLQWFSSILSQASRPQQLYSIFIIDVELPPLSIMQVTYSRFQLLLLLHREKNLKIRNFGNCLFLWKFFKNSLRILKISSIRKVLAIFSAGK